MAEVGLLSFQLAEFFDSAVMLVSAFAAIVTIIVFLRRYNANS